MLKPGRLLKTLKTKNQKGITVFPSLMTLIIRNLRNMNGFLMMIHLSSSHEHEFDFFLYFIDIEKTPGLNFLKLGSHLPWYEYIGPQVHAYRTRNTLVNIYSIHRSPRHFCRRWSVKKAGSNFRGKVCIGPSDWCGSGPPDLITQLRNWSCVLQRFMRRREVNISIINIYIAIMILLCHSIR